MADIVLVFALSFTGFLSGVLGAGVSILNFSETTKLQIGLLFLLSLVIIAASSLGFLFTFKFLGVM